MKHKKVLISGLVLVLALLMACNLSTVTVDPQPSNQVAQIVAQTMVADTQEALFAALLMPRGQPDRLPTPLCGGIPRCGTPALPMTYPCENTPIPPCQPTVTPPCVPTATNTLIPTATAINTLDIITEPFGNGKILKIILFLMPMPNLL